MRLRFPWFGIGVIPGLLAFLVAELEAGQLGFNRDIRPILSANCLACHGPDGNGRKAGLRLDDAHSVAEKGVISSGNPDASKILQRVTSLDPDFRMPPPGHGEALKPEEVSLLRQWIQEGAPFEQHWAFLPPKRPEVPVSFGNGWAVNPVDHFVARRIQERGWKPNPRADLRTLARRLALVLTGLPPEPADLNRLLADDSDGALERYIDGLLASTRAGEHRARYWLDAARYGDTHGMHLDNYREIWPYRDWVVDAFNVNMPFDQFLVEQVAGDLLPEATLSQRIATGFNRCNVSTAEGGSIPEEVKVRYMIDRVETLSTVFLGLTAGCAVCHDHKYDPLSQKDFYSLGAFFNNTTEPAMDGNRKDSPPVVVLPDADHQKEWDQLVSHRRELRERLEGWPDRVQTWFATRKPVSRETWSPLPVDDSLLLHVSLVEGGQVPLPEGARWEEEHPGGQRGIRFAKGKGLERPLIQLDSNQPFSVSFWVRTTDDLVSSTLMEQTTTVPDPKDPKKKITVGWRITCSTQGAVNFTILDPKGGKVEGLLPGDEALTPRKWQHVCVRYSGGLSKTSLEILVNGEKGTPRPASQSYIVPSLLAEGPLKLAPSLPTGGLSDVRVYSRWLTDGEARVLASEFRLQELLAGVRTWDQLAETDRELLRGYQRLNEDPKYIAITRDLAATERRVDYIHSRSVTTLVSEEKPHSQPRAWVLRRGQYDLRGEEVRPSTPGVLPPMPPGASPNRLGLAQWLVDPGHPLTARVMVNRLWQSVFGAGLVRTSEDFGVMGDPPSHPELLDWLAVEFVESGWNVRHLLKLMVTSSTFLQDSRIQSHHLAGDPANRLLARGPRRRLDAEVIRDQALMVSGLLSPQIGGPSVKPYQPEGLWKVVAFAGSNTRDFKADSGEAQYRRSLYTFWKRTSPPPNMAAFDAPTREQCTVRRERTNTPLQALVLMNDPQFVEAARRLALLTLAGNPVTEEERLARLYERVLARPVSPKDLQVMRDSLQKFRAHFRDHGEGARSLVRGLPFSQGPDESAAWILLSNTLVNRDDFLNLN